MSPFTRFRLLNDNIARSKLPAARGSGGEVSSSPSSPPDFWTRQQRLNAERMRAERIDEWLRLGRRLGPWVLLVVASVVAVLVTRSVGSSGSVIVDQIRLGF